MAAKFPAQEMNQFISQFPPDDANIGDSLLRLEQDVTAIRSSLDTRVKKMSLVQLSAKIDYLNKMLVHNGFVLPDEIVQSSTDNKK